ncbi:MAG TPA: hypothetical protein VK158_05075 [Acidobacteriota bacterium]|nr:hypothetical protein [Acidobacteriota bacterium]
MQQTVTTPNTNITYEKLFEVLRAEKIESELQKLPPTFYDDIVAYLKLKHEALKKSQASTDAFASDHVETMQQQLSNARRIIADIYDRREKKIISLAINKSRTPSQLFDIQAMLAIEQQFFDKIVSVLSANRSDVLINVLSFKPASMALSPIQPPSEELVFEQHPTYECVADIPEFFGPDMKHYGPYVKGEKVQIAQIIAKILLKKEQIRELM